MLYFVDLQKSDGTGRGTCAIVETCQTNEKEIAFDTFDLYVREVRAGAVDADGVTLYAGRDRWSAGVVESWAKF